MKRLFVVVLIALVGFAAAFAAFGDAARRNCVLRPPTDPRYDAAVTARVGDDLVVRVTRDGAPVTDAWVCVNVVPAGVDGAGVGAEAQETEPGRYVAPADVSTPGRWSGTVVVAEEGGGEVGVRVTFDAEGAARR